MNEKQKQILAKAYNYEISQCKELLLSLPFNEAISMITGLRDQNKFDPEASMSKIIKTFYQDCYDAETKVINTGAVLKEFRHYSNLGK